MENPDEIREALNAAAVYLSKDPYASKRLLFVAGAIEKFLKDDAPSLDRAFGFTKGRGQYKREDNEEHIELVCKAIKMRLNCKPFKTISELSGYDEKEFRKLWNRYKGQAMQRIADSIHIEFNDP